VTLFAAKPYDRSVDAEAAARAWVDAWDGAWRAKDESALEPVYAEHAVHRSHPDREPHSPIEYARSAFADEGDDLDGANRSSPATAPPSNGGRR